VDRLGADPRNVDMGRPRTYGDTLAISGQAHARNLAAAINAATLWEKGLRPGLARRYKTTFAEKEKTFADHPEILESVRFISSIRRDIPVAPSVLALGHWLFDAIARDDAAQFFVDVASGAGLDYGNAALTLRNRLISDRLKRRGALDERDAAALMIMAWNAYHERRPLTKLQLPNPLTLKNFPEPH